MYEIARRQYLPSSRSIQLQTITQHSPEASISSSLFAVKTSLLTEPQNQLNVWRHFLNQLAPCACVERIIWLATPYVPLKMHFFSVAVSFTNLSYSYLWNRKWVCTSFMRLCIIDDRPCCVNEFHVRLFEIRRHLGLKWRTIRQK